MTDKLKCPFCGAELVGHEDAYGNISDIWFDCPNEECEHAWTTFRFDVWQALISGKKAQDALKIVDGKLKVIANDENPSPIQSQALDCYIQIAKDCRDIITLITKQEDK